MKCGCSQPADSVITCKRGPTLAVHATRAAMCATCPERRADNSLGTCEISGRAVVLHLNGEPCGLGRHPDAGGRVKWLGVLWRGVPFPLRLALQVRWPRRNPWRLPGCGCLDRLKAWVERKP